MLHALAREIGSVYHCILCTDYSVDPHDTAAVIARQLNLGIDPKLYPFEELCERIARSIDEGQAARKPVLVLLDDAQEYTANALSSLLSLCGRSSGVGVKIVAFLETREYQDFDRLGLNEFDGKVAIRPIPFKLTRQFLAQCMRGSSFTDADILTINRLAEGNPERLLLASRHLIDERTRSSKPVEKNIAEAIRERIANYFEFLENKSWPKYATGFVGGMILSTSVVSLSEDRFSTHSYDLATAASAATANVAAATEPKGNLNNAHVPNRPEAALEPVLVSVKKRLPVFQGINSRIESSAKRPTKVDMDEQPDKRLLAGIASINPEIAAPITKGEPVYVAHERELLNFDEQGLVAQIMAGPERSQPAAVLEKHPNAGLRLFRSYRGGMVWYKLVTTPGRTQQDLDEILESLPVAIKQEKYWIRKLAAVHKEIISMRKQLNVLLANT